MTIVLALRGVAAIVVLTTLVGGVPRIVQAGLAITLGLWAALVSGAEAPEAATWLAAAHELVVGATLGILAALPLLAAAAAGRLVDIVGSAAGGPYAQVFSVLAAAVFVGIDGHVTVVSAVVESYRAVPSIASAQPKLLAALGALVPAAVALAVPWLVTAAVVEIAVGTGMRLAGRAGAQVPTAAAVPAALVMITATLVATLAVGITVLIRGAL